jgi:hypothetical protein
VIPLRDFCLDAQTQLQDCAPADFGRLYVDLTLALLRRYKYGPGCPRFGLFSSLHGPGFFSTLLDCLDGADWEGKGEYGANFRTFIAHYRAV